MYLGDYIKNEILNWPNWLNSILLRLNCLCGLVYGFSYRKFKKHLNTANPDDLLLEAVNNAIQHVPYYRNRYGNLVLHSVEEFREKIGFINKDEVMANWDEFLIDDIDWHKVSTGTTGGTSGKPLKLVFPKNRYAWELAYMHSMWEKSGWHYHTRGVIRNHDLKGRNYAINPIMKEVIFDPNRLSEEYVGIICNTLKHYNIKYITAYPSNAYQFCKLCLKQHIDFDFIEAFLCGSEGITDEQMNFFDRFNIHVLTWYGHSEKLILGSNDTKSWSIQIEKNYGYCEIIGDDQMPVKTNGSFGEMTGTTFYNKYFPLIRYKTGDFAVVKEMDQRMKLSKIFGRWDKSLIYKYDGTTTSLTVLNLHGKFYEHIDGIQYVQEKKGFLKVLLIKNNLYTEDDENFIIQHIGKALGGNQFVSIEYASNLIYQPNGKFLPLISKL